MKLDCNRVDLEMARKQLTVTELCQKAGIAYPSFAQIRSGRVVPKPVTIGKLARALGLDPAELLSQEEGAVT